MTTYAVVRYPDPTVDGPACQACEGKGVTGEQYAVPIPGKPALLCDVFCPSCGGCGSAAHDACDPAAHAEPEDWDAEPEDWDAEDDPCPSCQGRGWNAVQGFGGTDTGNDEDVTVRYLRVPCGCQTSRVELVEAAE